ncbi:hypothetical protein E2C01_059623 [Portunus trituberculatus]|uniref:Uncharacterized protein n=1 Tax=Portunus trituberculatus TaxID=210409 RepID=A0A5B7H8X4_PORTR|nr:hypothetical protein [Portunus trituberculatus]
MYQTFTYSSPVLHFAALIHLLSSTSPSRQSFTYHVPILYPIVSFLSGPGVDNSCPSNSCLERGEASLSEASEHGAASQPANQPSLHLCSHLSSRPARAPPSRPARRQYAPGCVGVRVRRSPLAAYPLPTLIDWILAHLCGCLSPDHPRSRV